MRFINRASREGTEMVSVEEAINPISSGSMPVEDNNDPTVFSKLSRARFIDRSAVTPGVDGSKKKSREWVK